MAIGPINGNGSNNTLIGGSGPDIINGKGGDDTLFGLGGSDVLNGGNGDDQLYGGGGADILNGDRGDDQLFGGGGDDTLDGGRGDDFLDGGAGDDTLEGGRGDDILLGGGGGDSLSGGRGNDYLGGGGGSDTLDGGRGNDMLEGGAGADVFAFKDQFGDDVITDFDNTDTIDLTAITGLTNLSQLTLTQVGTNVLITSSVFGGGSITVNDVTVAQLAGQIQVACLMRGTKVLTPSGDAAIETLSIGDMVTTIDGVARPIKWIGRRGYSRSFVEASARIAPVLIAAGAFGPNVPASDLYVSPDHAVCVDHVLVPAGLLVNGTTIRQVTDFDAVEYFHLEFEAPEVIFTNGAPTESYVNHDNRRMFQNYAEYAELYGEETTSGERRRRFEEVVEGGALAAIRDRLSNKSNKVA